MLWVREMVVTKCEIMQEDMVRIVQDETIAWEQFRGCSILVTGATGLIGRQVVMSLLLADAQKDLDLCVIAAVRNVQKAERVFSEIIGNAHLILHEQDIKETFFYTGPVDYIIHAASATASKEFVERPVETIETAYCGCRNILQLAKDKHIRGGVFLSSMEVYGVSAKEYLTEDDYGYLDHINVRSSYSEGKKMCECLCASYYKEYHVPFKIARLTQTFGPGVEKDDNRVFAQFAKAVLQKENIVLFTEGKTVRNYCYTADAVRAILLILLKGEAGQVYNAANMETEISIYDMASMLMKEYHKGKYHVEIRLEQEQKHGFNPVSRTCIDSSKLAALGWKPEIGLKEAFERMMQGMEKACS